MRIEALSGWTSDQKHVVAASFLGWALDAFDFFLLVFVLTDVAKDFGTEKKTVALALTLTLACRPVGALIFGRLADRFGRRPLLMVDVALYSVLGFATAFAPNLTAFLVIRALFGIAMGGDGVWVPRSPWNPFRRRRAGWSRVCCSRGIRPAICWPHWLRALYNTLGWRGMFMLSLIPAMLVLFIRRNVPESPTWASTAAAAYRQSGARIFSRASTACADDGFQFLQSRHPGPLSDLPSSAAQARCPSTGTIAIIYNIGAIIGGWTFGFWSSRGPAPRHHHCLSAQFAVTPVGLLDTAVGFAVGAFLMQAMRARRLGVVPAHLNELSPATRATFPGTIYQLGNLIASVNAPLQAGIAAHYGGDYAIALAAVAGTVAVVIVVLTAVGTEAKGVAFGHGEAGRSAAVSPAL